VPRTCHTPLKARIWKLASGLGSHSSDGHLLRFDEVLRRLEPLVGRAAREAVVLEVFEEGTSGEVVLVFALLERRIELGTLAEQRRTAEVPSSIAGRAPRGNAITDPMSSIPGTSAHAVSIAISG
jgi:hypothetical protein